MTVNGAGERAFLACLSLSALLAAANAVPLRGESAWGVQGRWLTLDGEPTFLSGVNYVPSKGWLTHLELWDAAAVDRDFEALARAGVQAIRYLPLWSQLQPTPEGADPIALARLDAVIDLAEKHGIFVQLGIFNSWMSGGVFLPSWAHGNLFKDRSIRAGELTLARELAARYGGRRSLQGFDLGNELNVLESRMDLDMDASVVETWQEEIAAAIRRNASGSLLVNGVGTGYTESFNIESIARSTDYMAAHSYPYFHGTSRLDPWLGQRTTYSTNYIVSWAETTGKPVLMQELGVSEQWAPPGTIPRYLKLTFLSNWMEGAAGYLWWCSHDIDADFAVSDRGLYKEYSTARLKRENKFNELNYDMGILSNDNSPKPAAEAFEYAAGVVDRLGVGWENKLPVCYILVPEDFEYESTMIESITPFVLAKQAHMDVKLLFAGNAVPPDAAAVVIPGFSLSPIGKSRIGEYLKAGGVVYQSYFNDFGNSVVAGDGAFVLERPRLVVTRRAGAMELEQRLAVGAGLRVRPVSVTGDAETILSLPRRNPNALEGVESDASLFGESEGPGVLFRMRHGDGVYYYMAADIERALTATYDPWGDDDTNLVYSVLRPPHGIDIDSKYLELHHKTRGGRQLVALLNHSPRFVDAMLHVGSGGQVVDALTGQVHSNDAASAVRVEPAGARFFFVNAR